MIDFKLLEYLKQFLTPARMQRFEEILKERTNYLTVAIEDVYQMHNTSAVIRSCDVFGVQSAHLIEGRFGKRLDKNIALGAQQWVDVYRYTNTTDCIDQLKQKGYQIIATTPHNDSCYLHDFDITGKTAIFFGTERRGLSKEVLEKADGSIKIPMVGFSESLNISVSAAIILQALTVKMKKMEGIAWELTEEEKQCITLDWYKKSIRSIDDILNRYNEIKD